MPPMPPGMPWEWPASFFLGASATPASILANRLNRLSAFRQLTDRQCSAIPTALDRGLQLMGADGFQYL
jgi:hypothetical protein